MMGSISGLVIFSDGHEAIINTSSGVGYQMFCSSILPEGESASVYISHVVKETSEQLFAFKNLREKKLFELLTTVKGVGPKSAFLLVSQISQDEIINAIQTDQKKILTRVSGIGAKAASQIILDLQNKIQKIKMYSLSPVPVLRGGRDVGSTNSQSPLSQRERVESRVNTSHELVALERVGGALNEPESFMHTQKILEDTLLACTNLGFSNEKIIPLAQKLLKENEIRKTEQLVHLVLKEL